LRNLCRQIAVNAQVLCGEYGCNSLGKLVGCGELFVIEASMSTRNTDRSFGWVTRSFHWLTALLILTAFPIGLIANDMDYSTAETLAQKAQLFSLHKTLGVAVFFVALARILWALSETHPAPLHPERRLETGLAEFVHWLLYVSLVVVPLSGWTEHSAVTGFAPIWWPFGQALPFVPQSESVAHIAGAVHWWFTKILAVTVILHVVGALKHAVIDRDGTMSRMILGRAAPDHPQTATRNMLPIVAAFAIYALGAAAAISTLPKDAPPATEATAAAPANEPAQAATSGNWQVASGTLEISVKQMGADVKGDFANWTAEIAFEETPVDGKNGHVKVVIDTTSLKLGSVTDQAKGKDFFDTAAFPQAIYEGDILPDAAGFVVKGTLDLHGKQVPVDLPFTLKIEGDTATMEGSTNLARLDFDMGKSYGDEKTIGFPVAVNVALTAKRK
jgi:cytochrome b561/polyisoprenoid-binding protein YceI